MSGGAGSQPPPNSKVSHNLESRRIALATGLRSHFLEWGHDDPSLDHTVRKCSVCNERCGALFDEDDVIRRFIHNGGGRRGDTFDRNQQSRILKQDVAPSQGRLNFRVRDVPGRHGSRKLSRGGRG